MSSTHQPPDTASRGGAVLWHLQTLMGRQAGEFGGTLLLEPWLLPTHINESQRATGSTVFPVGVLYSCEGLCGHAMVRKDTTTMHPF